MPVRHRQRDRVLQSFQRAHDQGAMRPRTSERDIEMIAAGLGPEAAFPCWPRSAVGRDPVAVARFPTNKSSTGALGVIPLVFPHSLDQHAHKAISLLSASATVLLSRASRRKGQPRMAALRTDRPYKYLPALSARCRCPAGASAIWLAQGRCRLLRRHAGDYLCHHAAANNSPATENGRSMPWQRSKRLVIVGNDPQDLRTASYGHLSNTPAVNQ